MQFLALSLFALGAAAVAIEKRGGGGGGGTPPCSRTDWLEISYAEIAGGKANLGFKVPYLFYSGSNYTAQIVNYGTCTAQSEVGKIASDFKLTVVLEDWDQTTSITYNTTTAGDTEITFPATLPGTDAQIFGDVSLVFSTSKKPSHVNDLLNKYGVVFGLSQ